MDRITKALLALIAVALWGLLLKPLISLPAAQAAPAGAATGVPSMVCVPNSSTLFVAQGGHVYKLEDYPKLHVTESATLK